MLATVPQSLSASTAPPPPPPLMLSSPVGLEPAQLGRTTSLPCIASPTCTLSPSSSPFSSALASPISATSPLPPTASSASPSSSSSSSSLLLHATSTLTTLHTTATATLVQDTPPTSSSSAPSSSRLSFFSLSASTTSSTTSASLTLSSSSPPADDALSPSPSTPSSSSSLFKSFTRPILSLYASLRISCLPSSTTPAQRLQWAAEQANLSSPVHVSMGGDTEMGSIAALGEERRRVRQAAGGASLWAGASGGEVKEVREVREVSRASQLSRVSRLRRSRGSGVEHSRRSSSLSRWRTSASRSSRAPSSPSSLGGGRLDPDESLEDVTDGSEVDEEREEEVSMAVFNASPLVLMDHRSSSITPVPVSRLDIDGEKEQIRRLLAKSTAPLHCAFHQLTLENLSEELIAEPDILHLSGHGLHTSDGAYALALEHDNGSVSLLSMPSLARLLSALPHLPKLVVILACHSEPAGRVFADAGVEHVVCVRAAERILDSSAKYLTKFLYASLIAGFSVHTAFEVAKRNVEVVYDGQRKDLSTALPTTPSSPSTPAAPVAGSVPLPMSRSMTTVSSVPESAKFLLLPESSPHSSVLFTRRYPRRCAVAGRGACASPHHGHSPSQSSTTIFPRRHPSPAMPSATSLASPVSPMSPLPPSLWSPSPLHSNLPSRPSAIVGREIEVQKVISALLSHRLVNIYGPPKAGKTSVALLAAHFQRERGRWADGVFYVSMRGVGGMEGREGESDDEVRARDARLVSHLAYVLGLEGSGSVRSLRSLFQLIRDSDVLLVVDDCSSSPCYSFLLDLMLSTTRPRLIAISDCDARHFFALDSRQSTASVEVGGLSQPACLSLIRRLCGENGWSMREAEMVAFAALCRWEAWEVVVRMRRVAMKEKEGGGGGGGGGRGRRREEEGGREREEKEGMERGGGEVGGEGEEWDEEAEEAALKPMAIADFVEVSEEGCGVEQ